ncbi:hypothetical protein [Phyllobacterium myrsinacearum]|uniref:Uncharacterized protein n=1 Tax=Phyllobacterium myrsinacearum TaxID=28101 RepID=A0A2S9J9V5_9HYPH|nr:hypothetical protein [Phyllobacterium myrsinacearum]PRD49539.1 hypothetical protein C5750_26010 [Phyllobacterium myrsinacearum]PWV83461.1 hypothetical protein DEV92_1236 [Phyllobacterium myrsinacearum]RZU96803.1 hypothetical protein EV654_5237 [Phyllobacterium myrsinacearum]
MKVIGSSFIMVTAFRSLRAQNCSIAAMEFAPSVRLRPDHGQRAAAPYQGSGAAARKVMRDRRFTRAPSGWCLHRISIEFARDRSMLRPMTLDLNEVR